MENIGVVDSYRSGIDRLTSYLKLLNKLDWSPTPSKKKADAIASQIAALVQTLEEREAVQSDIEREQDSEPETEVGVDGIPIWRERWSPSYKSIVSSLKALGASAKAVADGYPAPQKRTTIPTAAMALLHLRHAYGMPPPTFYDESETVRELVEVLESASIYKDASTCRKYLSEAYKDFDPHHMPIHIQSIVLGNV